MAIASTRVIPPMIRPRRIVLAVCIAVTGVSTCTPTAVLASGRDVLLDCNDNGKLDKKYTRKEYRDAIENIPTDLDEYTDCRDVIRRAQLGLSAAPTGTPGGPGGTPGAPGTSVPGAPTVPPSANASEALANATPAERAALAEKTATGSEPVRVGGEVLEPGNSSLDGLSSSTALPTPLIAIVVLLGAAGLAGLVYAGRDTVLSRIRPRRG